MNENYPLAADHDPDFDKKHPFTSCYGDGSPRGYCRCDRTKEHPMHTDALCNKVGEWNE